jgi:hypothetical protein
MKQPRLELVKQGSTPVLPIVIGVDEGNHCRFGRTLGRGSGGLPEVFD